MLRSAPPLAFLETRSSFRSEVSCWSSSSVRDIYTDPVRRLLGLLGPPMTHPPSASFQARVTCTVYLPEASFLMSRRRSAVASLKLRFVAAKKRISVAYCGSMLSAMSETSDLVRKTLSRDLTEDRGARMPLATFSVTWRSRTAVSSAADSSA